MRFPSPRAPIVSVLICILTLPAQVQAAPKPKKGAPAPAAPPTAPPAPVGPKPLSETLTGGAKADYEAAKLLYGDGDHAGALVKFQSAFDQSKDPRLLWNMAACEKNLRHYAKVMALVDRYLKEGGSLLVEQDRRDAKDLLGAIESFTAALTLEVSEAGAEVSIDDEVVGSTPLGKPIIVDLGVRRIKVKKEGFREASLSVPIGGSKEVSQSVKLEREVHEGKLTVHSAPDAGISLDGKDVGTGSFDGTVPSGGHTLRVTAPGMRPYQTEVVISDNETRTVDVALESVQVAGPPPEKHGALYGMELGLRTGYGKEFLSDDQRAGFIPIWLDIGYRIGTPTLLGIYGQFGWTDRSHTCGVRGRHGPDPESPTDDSIRYAYESCHFVKAGVQLLFHTLPRTIVDPWFGFDAGIHASFNSYRSYDPVSAQYSTGQDNNASFQPGFQLGIDTHPTRELGLGVFLHTGPEFGSEGKPQNNNDGNNNSGSSSGPCGQQGQPSCNNGNNCSNGNCDNNGNDVSVHWFLGMRVAYTFP
jgi:hypothetical protein